MQWRCRDLVSLFTREWIEMTGLDAMTMQGFSLPLYEGVDWNWTTRRSMQTCWKSPSLRGSGLKSSGVSKRTNLFFVSLFTREWIEIFCWTNANKCEQSPSLRGSGLKLPVQGRTASHAEVSLFTREWIEIESAPHSRYLTIQSPSLRGSGLKFVAMFRVFRVFVVSPSLRGSGLKYHRKLVSR